MDKYTNVEIESHQVMSKNAQVIFGTDANGNKNVSKIVLTIEVSPDEASITSTSTEISDCISAIVQFSAYIPNKKLT